MYINGNAFHDPLRLSVSTKAQLLEETLKSSRSSFSNKLKDKFKVCVSGGGEWRYLDLLPRDGKTDTLQLTSLTIYNN